MREKILLAGEPNTSKTLSMVMLSVLCPDSRVYIFDPDDGTSKVIKELGLEDEDTLSVLPVTADWEQLVTTYEAIKGVARPQDWVCFDMLGRFWDLAQQYYSIEVFGKSPLQHLMELKRQAKSISFGGFDGLTDWTIIKRLHNEQLLDDALIRSPFNIMATTSVSSPLSVERQPKTGSLESVYLKEFGVKPEGEKHNIYRFDTQAMLFRTKENKYFFRLVRDRGRPVDITQEFEITGKSFFEVYKRLRGL